MSVPTVETLEAGRTDAAPSRRWRRWSWRRPFDYVVAATAVLMAALINIGLWPYIAPQISPLFFLAVMIAAWIGGLGPGLFATVFAAFLSIYLFTQPLGSLDVTLPDVLRLAVFFIVAMLTSWLTHRREVAELAVRQAHADLERRVAVRTAELSRVNQILEQEVGFRRETERELLGHQRQLEELASELAISEERQRRRLATLLHDDVGQVLSLTQIRLEQARQALGTTDLAHCNLTVREVYQNIGKARELLEQAISRARGLTVELSPPILYELGLEAAIDWLVEQTRGRTAMTMSFQTDSAPKPLGEQRSIILFQAVRELLANTQKHSRASRVEVSVSRRDDEIRMVVEDDGVGFMLPAESSHQTDSFGLFNVRERLRHEGASLHIDSTPGRGSRLEIVAPLEPKASR